MKRFLHTLLLALLTGSAPLAAMAAERTGNSDKSNPNPRIEQQKQSDKPSKAAVFFCLVSDKVNQFQLHGLDTNYITLPEYNLRLAMTTGGTGLHAAYTTWIDPSTPIALRSQTTPSLELGFNASYCGYGGGYSWDLLNAYTTNWNLSLGSMFIGIEFLRNVSTNLTGQFFISGIVDPSLERLNKGEIRIANTSLSAWYALNAAHYSHNAAIKQGYIQKRTAGSLLLSLGYMSSEMSILDSAKYIRDDYLMTLFDGVKGMVTRQVALGIGYGINYTPNKGKLLLHAAASMQLVCYSINHVSYVPPAGVYLPGEPQYMLRPELPVHVTGNMRAAVCWEINKWVHLSAWGQVNHLRFTSKAGDMSTLNINNWHWQAHLNIGVRFGAGRKHIRQVLGEPEPKAAPDTQDKQSKLPLWVTDFFFSSMK